MNVTTMEIRDEIYRLIYYNKEISKNDLIDLIQELDEFLELPDSADLWKE